MDIPRPLRSHNASTAIILGSGLGSLVDNIRIQYTVPYSDIDDVPAVTAPGHLGRLILGDINNYPIIAAQGRVHLYEGRSVSDVTGLVHMFHRAGVKKLIITNASGIVNEGFSPGCWMVIKDHLNLTGKTPFLGGPNFLDMSAIYSPTARVRLLQLAQANNMPLYEGVYAGLVGPQYETPAEVRMLRAMGADTVGMSTVLEAMQASVLGMEVIGFSCLTNWGAGINQEKLSHQDVVTAATAASAQLVHLLAAYFAS